MTLGLAPSPRQHIGSRERSLLDLWYTWAFCPVEPLSDEIDKIFVRHGGHHPKVSELCLAIPGKLEEREGRCGVVNFRGVRRKVDLSLVEECEVGDYLIVHAGFAIEVLDEKDALITLDIFRQIEAAIE